MKNTIFIRVLLIIIPFILSIVDSTPTYGAYWQYPAASQPSCNPFAAPRLVDFDHHPETSSRIYLTAVFSPDDHLINRSFYTTNGISWQTDLTPGDATCPVQIQNFIYYTLGTLNTGTPPFIYTQGHELAAYTAFLIRAHQTCTTTAIQQNNCTLYRLYLPSLSKQSTSP